MTELIIACSKFYFRNDSCYLETSQLIDSVNHLTGFYVILPLIEKKMFEQSLIRCIRLNSLYLLNLIRHQIYFTNYQDSFKSSLYQVPLKIDVSAKKRNNKYLRRSSLFNEVTGCRPLIYFNFPTISMLIKIKNISFSGISRSGCFFQYAAIFTNNSHWMLLSFQ